MRNQKVSFIQIYFRQKFACFQSNISKVWGNQWGIEIGRERGGPASVSEPVMKKQDCTKID